MPSRRSPFASEAETKPGAKRSSAEAPTVPPPGKGRTPKRSTVRPKERTSIPAATVDEVTADLTNDPRRDDD